jgi:hypothetical protein
MLRHDKSRRDRRLAGGWLRLIAALVFVTLGGVAAPAKTWDHIANIKASAVHLAQLQGSKGALGAFEFIAACYKTHELASDYGAPLEACLVQDYILSRVTAAVYAKLPTADRERMGVPAPNVLISSMLGRIGGAMSKYKLKQADAEKLIVDIDRHGMPEFTRLRFPTAGQE